MLMKRLMGALAAWAMLVVPVAPAAAKGPKYAKTEVEKAVGKCIGSVLIGALAGALVGRVVGGKRGLGAGAAVGAAGGGVVCGILIANAKRQDRIIQAQMAAAAQPDRPFNATWTDENGLPVTFTTKAGPIKAIDASRLEPVRYPGADGSKLESPILDTGNQECRYLSGAITASDGSGGAPEQLYCRTSAGDYQPYSEKRT